MSDKSVRLECPTRVSYKSVLPFDKSVPQECPTRMSDKSAPKECPTRVSTILWALVFEYVFAFGFVRGFHFVVFVFVFYSFLFCPDHLKYTYLLILNFFPSPVEGILLFPLHVWVRFLIHVFS